MLVTDNAKEGKMMEIGIGGTDALDWDIFLLVRTWAPANVKVRGGGGKDQLLV